MTLQSFFLIFAGGIVTGVLGALLGLGGGVFFIPYLVLLLGVPIHQAIATGIVCVIATSSAAASVNVERKFTNIRLGMVLEVATTAGAILGGFTANALSGAVLSKVFGGLLFLVAFLMIRRVWMGRDAAATAGENGWIRGSYFDPAANREVTYTVRRLPVALSFSLIAGNLSGLLGIGGGVIKVPAMNLLCGVPMKAATATSNFMIGVTAVASAFIYYANNRIHPVITCAAVIGVLVGSMVGTTISAKIHGRTIALIFTLVLLILGIQMILR
ncbi:MAG: sulfite exporter TauE/SafE family protein [Bacteroidota bacterium]